MIATVLCASIALLLSLYCVFLVLGWIGLAIYGVLYGIGLTGYLLEQARARATRNAASRIISQAPDNVTAFRRRKYRDH